MPLSMRECFCKISLGEVADPISCEKKTLVSLILGEHHAAIKAIRIALSDESEPPNEVINLQYFLACALESAGQMAEAATLYSRIAHTSPLFKDAARRAKKLSPMPKPPVNGKRETTRNASWFGHVIESFNQLMGSRK